MRTAEAKRIVAAQHQYITMLKATGAPTLEAERSLSTYESSLRHLEEHEAKLRKEHRDKYREEPEGSN
jgi:hypothetical protein